MSGETKATTTVEGAATTTVEGAASTTADDVDDELTAELEAAAEELLAADAAAAVTAAAAAEGEGGEGGTDGQDGGDGGAGDAAAGGTDGASSDAGGTDGADAAAGGEGAAGGDGEAKGRAHLVTEAKALYPYMAGSVEERQQELRDALDDLLLPPPTLTPSGNQRVDAYVSLDATFADHVVATLTDYSGASSESQAFDIPYTVGEDGEVQLGEPSPVDKVVSIVPDTDAGDSDDPKPPLMPMAQQVNASAKRLEKAVGEIIEAKGTPDPDGVQHLRLAADHLTAAVAALEPAEAPEAKGGDEPDEVKELKALLDAADAQLLDDAADAVLAD